MTNFYKFRCTKNSKTFLFLIIISIIWIHTYINYTLRNDDSDSRDKGVVEQNGRLGNPAFVKDNPQPRLKLSKAEIKNISDEIIFQNQAQIIYNYEKFGPVNNSTYVMVVQVHSRLEYLSLLIESLQKVQNIENSLIIFSHDLYMPQLNEAIRNIDFAKVMQIFYPYSIQLNPNTFPGHSPDDCPRDISPSRAKIKKCRNADYPDVYGHYRESAFVQTKHHWWWKANFIFGRIRELQNYTGVVAFLEEDHFVTPDFIWMINLLETAMVRNLCNACNLMALGTYLKTWNIRASHSRAIVTSWVSSKHNMGMAFNRTLWAKLKFCAPTFCGYDDYNWDWSLLQVSYSCLKEPLTVLYPKSPRIFHIGDCGIHHKKKQCSPLLAAQSIEKGVKKYQSLLFPDNLLMEIKNPKRMRLKKGNGGWGDKRDKTLCMTFADISYENNPSINDIRNITL